MFDVRFEIATRFALALPASWVRCAAVLDLTLIDATLAGAGFDAAAAAAGPFFAARAAAVLTRAALVAADLVAVVFFTGADLGLAFLVVLAAVAAAAFGAGATFGAGAATALIDFLVR